MNIGPINIRCRIERKTSAVDPDYGTETITWALLGSAWCGMQDSLPSNSESVKTGLAVALNQTRVRMRYRTDIDSSMRIVVDRPTRTYYQIIAGPVILGNKDGIEMMCEKSSTVTA